MLQTTLEPPKRSPEPPGSEWIGLAFQSRMSPGSPVRVNDFDPTSLCRQAALLIGVAVLLRFVPFLGGVDFVTLAFGLFLSAIALSFVVQFVRARARTRLGARSDNLEPPVIHAVPTLEHRVWCVGTREQLRAVNSGSIDPHAAFEPWVFPIWTPQRRWYFSAASVLLSTACAIGMYLIIHHGLGQNVPGFWALLFGLSCGPAITAWPFRRYTRITPGAVEVLSFGFLGIGREPVARVDLRIARVIADLTQSCVFVIQPDGTNATIELVNSDQKHEIARAVLHAALCRAQVPQLPDDALVG